MPELKIAFAFCKGLPQIDINKRTLRKELRSAAALIEKFEGRKFGTVEFAFVSTAQMRDLNRRHLKHDYETDILTFDMTESDNTEGQIVIAPEVVADNSVRFRQGLNRELMRVMIHGLLHLAGYNDNDKISAKRMRRKENEYLRKINNAGKSN